MDDLESEIKLSKRIRPKVLTPEAIKRRIRQRLYRKKNAPKIRMKQRLWRRRHRNRIKLLRKRNRLRSKF